jgi:hypothetical protein
MKKFLYWHLDGQDILDGSGESFYSTRLSHLVICARENILLEKMGFKARCYFIS